jgi:UDP-2-acetamido-2-deoxy-ribo-hexuluronate aminotransferase
MIKEIRMVDLTGQYAKIKNEIDTAIQVVIDSASFIKGKEVKLFEASLASYLGTSHVISCGNGTDALQAAIMALDLQPGDEIITTPFTFVATVEVIKLLCLKPVLVDIDPGTFNIDEEKITKAITSHTKAIIPVHLFGQCSNMEKITEIALKNNLFIIEDAAQALGTDYYFSDGKKKKAGTIGTIGCTSFFPSKNLGAFGDGGAIFTNDPELSKKLRLIVNHGMEKKYYYESIGVNSRLDTLQAAILNVKLKYLDDYNKARQKAAGFYDSALQDVRNITIPAKSTYSSHIYHQYTLKIGNGKRDALHLHLEKNKIPVMIYYPISLHSQPAYLDLDYKAGDFPVSENICKEVLSLPMHTELDDEQLNFIIEKVIEFVI